MKFLVVLSTLLYTCFLYLNIYSVEYLYPIDVFKYDDEDIILLMYQSPFKEIQVFAWHTEKKIYAPLLSKQYSPTSVNLLPDMSGFSFVDNGLLKVKRFDKRSVLTIEFDKPIYDIGYIEWIDAEYCYFHAKYGNRYGIYQSDMRGQVTPLVADKIHDNMYPQKVDDKLFYIEHIRHHYKIIAIDYFHEDCLNPTKTMIKDFGNIPIAYLSMIDKYEGFVITHPTHIEIKNETINFQMYHIRIFDGTWSCEKILDFDLPAKLFFDNNYLLHEDIMPFLPRISKQGVNFNSVRRDGLIVPMHYQFKDHSIKACFCESFFKWPSQETIIGFFAPILVGYQYIYGCMWDS